MNRTKIPYCDFTWNPTCGCRSDFDCWDRCWARKLHNMRHKAYKAGKKLPDQYAKPFTEIQCFEDRLSEPLKRQKLATIAVSLMGDLFLAPVEFIDRVFAVMTLCPQHTFLLLSKRVNQMVEYYNRAYTEWWSETICEFREQIDYSTDPVDWDMDMPNVWIGTSMSTQQDADERIPKLLQIPAAHYWLSLEPAIEPINISFYLRPKTTHEDTKIRRVSWVVIGAESGPNRRPCKLEWVKSIIDQCDAAGTPVFIKQLDVGGRVSTNPQEWPEEFRRQDRP